MSEPKKTAPAEELADFCIPRGEREERAEVIGVNGELIRVLPGVTVRVRPCFVEAWANARAQETAAWEARVRAMNASKKALAEL